MYTLFNSPSATTSGILRDASWMYLRSVLEQNVNTVTHYYRTSPFAVKSQHFLVRLLHALGIPRSMNLERYFANVSSVALNRAMAMGMTSAISKGKLFNGVFYGPGNAEILIADDAEFNFDDAHQHWESLTPIKVLRHPRSDLNLNIPNGVNSGMEEGLVVVVINIPMLAVQYRAFREVEGKRAFMSGDNPRSIMQFLHMYPLTNMLRSHMDLVMFNRMQNLVFDRPMGAATVKHPFILVNHEREILKFEKTVLSNLERVGKDFYDILRTIPAVTEDSLLDVMKLPDIPPTRQVDWALTIARLPALNFLFKISKGHPSTKNQAEVNQIMRQLQAQKTDNLMRSSINNLSVFLDVETELNHLRSYQ